MSQTIHTAARLLALALFVSAPLAASAADAMRVVRDPATGELRAPNAAEAAAFEKAEAQLRQSQAAAKGKAAISKGPTEIRYADGTVETKLGEDSMMFSVVSSDENGNLTFDCLPAEEAKKFVKATKSSKAKAKAKVNHAH